MIPAMPTLTLLQTPPNPDAWHQVKAPGGYEGWYFDAEDGDAKLKITGFIGQGCRFEGSYRKQYFRYRRHPTKNPPPVPCDFGTCEWHIGGKIGDITASLSGRVQASTDHLDVALGANQLTSDGEGIRLKLSNGNNISIELRFATGSQRLIVTPPGLDNRHHWMKLPGCQVTGVISVSGEKHSFQGSGSLEHRHGTAPIG